MAVRLQTSEIIAFRLRAHHLLQRLPPTALLSAAGACGVQNSPPGAALLALSARVAGVTQERFDWEVAQHKDLLQTWCLRGSPYFFPTQDAPVFTTGVLPSTEAARLRLIAGVEPALHRLGLGLDEAVDLAAVAASEVLSGRALAIGELGEQLAQHVAGNLTPTQRVAWRDIGTYSPGQPLGEAVMHFCVRLLALRGLVCLGPRRGNTAPFVLLAQWLGHALPQRDPSDCRAALLRRYLHCYGPSTRADFAAWVGVRAADVDPWWQPLADELAAVEVDGRRRWALARDLPAMQSATLPLGVRLLPPGDPYLAARDRSVLLDDVHRAALWKPAGSPGAVLANGRIVGVWRHRKRGRALTVTVRTFRSLNGLLLDQVREEAAGVAALRGASTADVDVHEGSG